MKRRSFSKILCTFLAGTLTLSVGMIGVGAAQIDDSFVSAETASPATGDGLPRAYSSRDLGFVTSVKSQYGQSCWAYASMATLESMLLRLGYDVADMSTDHLNLWATTRSDGTGWQRDIGSDGYPNIALGYLSSWQGGVLQSDAGDVSLNGSYTGDTIPLDLARYGVTSVEYLTKNRPDRIKQCIMDYGGVYSSFGINYAYYSDDRLSYYLPENYTGGYSGHSIEVVGWDDDYPRENFPQMPENNGAWLIKNSHGNYNSLGGYLWISYEDVYLFGSKFKPSYAITGAVPLDGGQKLIQNEIYGATYEFQYPEAPILTYLNRFTFDEAFNAIDKVIFKSDAVGASYSIYFVPDGADSTPDADQSHWTRLYDGTVSYAGYLCADIEDYDLPDTHGSIAVTVDATHTEVHSSIGVCEWLQNSAGYVFLNNSKRGDSYLIQNVKMQDLMDWYKEHEDDELGGTFVIKAVTVKHIKPTLLGDANLDGTVDINDVTQIQRHLAEFHTLTDTAAANADYNQDGEITIEDATQIQLVLAEFSTAVAAVRA